jgi:hypothetical protein
MTNLESLKDLLKIQGYDGNWNYDPYMHGMYNGLELALATLENRMANYRDAPKEWLRDRKVEGDILVAEPEKSHGAFQESESKKL